MSESIIASVFHFHWDAPIPQDQMYDIISSGKVESVIRAFLDNHYDRAADVLVDKDSRDNMLNDIYEMTNTISQPWTKNKGIIRHASKCRSTSIGDLIFIDGPYHVVKRFGFTDIHMPR